MYVGEEASDTAVRVVGALQVVSVPVMLAVGNAVMVTVVASEVLSHPLLLL